MLSWLSTRLLCWPSARSSTATAAAVAAAVAAPRATNRELADATIQRLQQEMATFEAMIINIDNEMRTMDVEIRAAVKSKDMERATRLLRKRKLKKAKSVKFFNIQCQVEELLENTQLSNIKMGTLEAFDMVAQIKNIDNSKVDELMTKLSEKLTRGDELSEIINQPLRSDPIDTLDEDALLAELMRVYGDGDNANASQVDMSLHAGRRENASRDAFPAVPIGDVGGADVSARGMGTRQPAVEAQGGKVLLHE